MSSTSLPEMPPQELAERLDRGEALQVLDVRASDKVERGHIAMGGGLDFFVAPNSNAWGPPPGGRAGVVRASDKGERGHIAMGAELDFLAAPNSKLLALPDVTAIGLDRARPVAVESD